MICKKLVCIVLWWNLQAIRLQLLIFRVLLLYISPTTFLKLTFFFYPCYKSMRWFTVIPSIANFVKTTTFQRLDWRVLKQLWIVCASVKLRVIIRKFCYLRQMLLLYCMIGLFYFLCWLGTNFNCIFGPWRYLVFWSRLFCEEKIAYKERVIKKFLKHTHY